MTRPQPKPRYCYPYFDGSRKLTPAAKSICKHEKCEQPAKWEITMAFTTCTQDDKTTEACDTHRQLAIDKPGLFSVSVPKAGWQ